MKGKIVNNTPYLRTSRQFPKDVNELGKEVDQAYVDIATSVNNRTIGIYPTNIPSITGNSYFFSGQKQQSLRQIYQVPEIMAGTTESIPVSEYLAPYSRIYGVVQTALDSKPIPYASVAANRNIEIYVDQTTSSIVISNGAAGTDILSGVVILEWISAI